VSWWNRRLISAEEYADLTEEVGELRSINDRCRTTIAKYDKAMRAILDEHAPFVARRYDGDGYETRCVRCRTNEHHTWATGNHMPWPCPTVAPLLDRDGH
jgi:hypothetical protein